MRRPRGSFGSVRSEFLYATDQGYISDTTETVELYDGAFLQMIGRGEGSVEWAEIHGTIEWTNFPQRRPDGVFLPDITGVIRLADHEHPIMYRLHGISLLPDKRDRRLFAGPVRWYTDRETLRFQTRSYVLHPEPPG